jgi:hypothetical protein
MATELKQSFLASSEPAGPVCFYSPIVGYPGTGKVSQESVFNWPILPNTDAEKHASAVHRLLDCLIIMRRYENRSTMMTSNRPSKNRANCSANC